MKKFNTLEEMLRFFWHQKKSDIWFHTKLSDIHLAAVTDPMQAILDPSQFRKDYGISDFVDDIAIYDCVTSNQIIITAKTIENDQAITLPLANSAHKSLLKRVRMDGLAFTKMTAEQMTNVLNIGTTLFDKVTLCLCRNNCIQAVHSAAKNGYEILPTYDLLKILLRSMATLGKITPGQMEFTPSAVRTELILAQNNTLLQKLNVTLQEAGRDPIDGNPCVTFINSDIAEKSISLHPSIRTSKKEIQIGEAITMRHMKGYSLDKFQHNCDMIFSMFRQSVSHLEKMLSISMHYPVPAFLQLCAKLKFQKPLALEVAEIFDITKPPKATAYDVYLQLWEYIYILLQRENSSLENELYLKEKVSRLITKPNDIKNCDSPFTWE